MEFHYIYTLIMFKIYIFSNKLVTIRGSIAYKYMNILINCLEYLFKISG